VSVSPGRSLVRDVLQRSIPDSIAEKMRRVMAYAKLFQQIADEEAKGRGARALPALHKMRTLALAILQEDVPGTKAAVTGLLGEKTLDDFGTSMEEDFSGVAMELISGTYLLGLRKEAGQLKDLLMAENRRFGGSFKQPEREAWVFEGIAKAALARVRLGSPATARAGIELLVETFRGLSTDLGRKYQGPPNDTADQALENLVEHTLQAYEVVAQGVLRDFQAGSGSEPKSVQAARESLGRMGSVFGPYYADTPLTLDSTPIEEGPTPRHVDAFDPARGPSIPITSYSQEEPVLKNKSLRLSRILEIRWEQLETLSWLHGHGKDAKTGAADPASQRNAEAMKSGMLKLHDNESWRTFVMARFEAAKTAGKSDHEALSETVDTIRRYLSAFTIHTPNNIDDFGHLTLAKARKENYLEREFPRALTGQLIHDCGVYALRVAYALSLVRDKLNLRFRAILLPVHIGLIITLDKFDSGPVFFVHNDLIVEVDREELKDLQADWIAAGNAFDEAKFLAAVSGSFFTEGVDMPYRLEDVPTLPQKTGKERRAKLWEFYLQKAAPRTTPKVPDVLKPIADDREPWLQYLEASQLQREINDYVVIPFWEEARKHWNALEHGRWVKNAEEMKKRLGADAADKYQQAVAPIWKDYWTMSQYWRERMESLAEARLALSAFLKEHPEALEKGASVIQGSNVFLAPGKHESLLWIYLGELSTKDERVEKDANAALKRAKQTKSTLLEGTSVEAPWSVIGPPEPAD
jgi:hypothetical protein